MMYVTVFGYGTAAVPALCRDLQFKSPSVEDSLKENLETITKRKQVKLLTYKYICTL